MLQNCKKKTDKFASQSWTGFLLLGFKFHWFFSSCQIFHMPSCWHMRQWCPLAGKHSHKCWQSNALKKLSISTKLSIILWFSKPKEEHHGAPTKVFCNWLKKTGDAETWHHFVVPCPFVFQSICFSHTFFCHSQVKKCFAPHSTCKPHCHNHNHFFVASFMLSQTFSFGFGASLNWQWWRFLSWLCEVAALNCIALKAITTMCWMKRQFTTERFQNGLILVKTWFHWDPSVSCVVCTHDDKVRSIMDDVWRMVQEPAAEFSMLAPSLHHPVMLLCAQFVGQWQQHMTLLADGCDNKCLASSCCCKVQNVKKGFFGPTACAVRLIVY